MASHLPPLSNSAPASLQRTPVREIEEEWAVNLDEVADRVLEHQQHKILPELQTFGYIKMKRLLQTDAAIDRCLAEADHLYSTWCPMDKIRYRQQVLEKIAAKLRIELNIEVFTDVFKEMTTIAMDILNEITLDDLLSKPSIDWLQKELSRSFHSLDYSLSEDLSAAKSFLYDAAVCEVMQYYFGDQKDFIEIQNHLLFGIRFINVLKIIDATKDFFSQYQDRMPLEKWDDYFSLRYTIVKMLKNDPAYFNLQSRQVKEHVLLRITNSLIETGWILYDSFINFDTAYREHLQAIPKLNEQGIKNTAKLIKNLFNSLQERNSLDSIQEQRPSTSAATAFSLAVSECVAFDCKEDKTIDPLALSAILLSGIPIAER